LFGRKAGALDGFKFSSAMKASGIVWDEAMLDKFLTKPKKLVPKTKMAFGGVKKQSQRDNLIAYLKDATKKK
jgi:cytochrome c